MRMLFWGRQLEADRRNVGMLVQKRKKEFTEIFGKYGDAIDQARIGAAEAKRTRKAMKRIKEQGK